MDSVDAKTMQEVRQTAASGRPSAAREVLEILGWSTTEAHTIPCPGVPTLERLVLGGYPTRAAVACGDTNVWGVADDVAYFAGNRWCFAVRKGTVQWSDFSVGEVWKSAPGELSREVLSGLTPGAFARVGRFEPRVEKRSPASRSVDAEEFLLERVWRWWEAWITHYPLAGDVESERDRFVQLLSALLLIKTLEDLDRIEWLRRGALRMAAARGADLPRLLRRCARTLNSRVLRGVAGLSDDAALVRPLVDAIEASGINFASLDVDPVGSFYAQLLGRSHEVSEARQLSFPMLGAGREIAEDVSIRRRQGVFFTPRSYADILARQLVLPAVRVAGSAEELPSVLDPTAGSGALLCAALREIFSESSWRQPDVARKVLAEKVWAIDLNPNAAQLAALNVLRTVVRLVPDMLDDPTPFPPLDANFIVGDSKRQSVLEKVPSVDVVLLNPPFRAHRHWKPPTDDAATAITRLPGSSNLAFAFLAVALDKTHEGGAVGAVMSSQLFSGIQHRSVREHIGRSLRIETVVENFGAPFPDALSYAGLLVGHKLEGCQLPRAEVITLPGGMSRAGVDFGASLFSATLPENATHEARAVTRWVSIDTRSPGDWTGTSRARTVASPSQAPRIALREFLHGGIHHGVEAAPRPWGYELFLFDEVPDGVFHRGGDRLLDDRTSALRAFSRPKVLVTRVANFCEPSITGQKVFLPGRGDSDGVTLRELRAGDFAAFKLARAIRDRIKSEPPERGANRSVRFAEEVVDRGRLRFVRSNGYTDEPFPQVVLSKASRSSAGRSRGVLWSAWVNLDGAVVPLEGDYARTHSAEHAIVLAVLLNVPAAIDEVLRDSPARNMGTVQPELSVLSTEWKVPDISAGFYQGVLGELVDAFHVYRAKARQAPPDDAHRLTEYQDVLELGAKLWRS